MWYAVYYTSTGELYSLTTELPAILPGQYAVIELDKTFNPEDVDIEWDKTTLAFKPVIRIDPFVSLWDEVTALTGVKLDQTELDALKTKLLSYLK